MQSFPDGREALIAFDVHIGEVLGASIGINYNDEGFILAKAFVFFMLYCFTLKIRVIRDCDKLTYDLTGIFQIPHLFKMRCDHLQGGDHGVN